MCRLKFHKFLNITSTKKRGKSQRIDKDDVVSGIVPFVTVFNFFYICDSTIIP